MTIADLGFVTHVRLETQKAKHLADARLHRSFVPGIAAVGAAALCIALAGCQQEAQLPAGVTGNPEQGKLLLRQYGCGSCHKIPGVASARGNVGPPLNAIANRVYLAGVLPNTPANMVRWIRVPQEIDPRTAMPNLQVSEPHARDMVAYLYRLK